MERSNIVYSIHLSVKERPVVRTAGFLLSFFKQGQRKFVCREEEVNDETSKSVSGLDVNVYDMHL